MSFSVSHVIRKVSKLIHSSLPNFDYPLSLVLVFSHLHEARVSLFLSHSLSFRKSNGTELEKKEEEALDVKASIRRS
jgi:hypothetical protein